MKPLERPQWHGSMEQLVGRVRERPSLLGLLGLIGLVGIPFQQPILFLFYLLFGLFALRQSREEDPPGKRQA